MLHLLIANAAASFYPPDYPVSTLCQTQSNIQVCAVNKGFNNPRIAISYPSAATLWAQASPINVWIQVNSQQGFFKLAANQDKTAAGYTVGYLRDVQLCYRATVQDDPTYPGDNVQYKRCPVTPLFPLLEGGPHEGSTGWFYNPPPQAELNLVKDQNWDIQVAFVNEKGAWDSQFGRNYRFKF